MISQLGYHGKIWVKGFAKNPILLIERARFLSHLEIEIYVGIRVCTGNLCKNPLATKYIQEKGYYELLILLCMLFVRIFVHTKECKHRNQIGVEPVLNHGVMKWCWNSS